MGLFDGVSYKLIPAPDPLYTQQLANLLNTNGGIPADTLEETTHVISDSDRFDGWEKVPSDIPVVTMRWVERSLVIGELQAPGYYSADASKTFSGTTVCCADLSEADEDAVLGTVHALGGQTRRGLTRDVTHLLALSTSSERYLTAKHYQADTRIEVVLPHWFDDSVALGRVLEAEPYAWPDPPVLRARPGDDAAGAAQLKDRAHGRALPPHQKSLLRAVVAAQNPDEKDPSAPTHLRGSMADTWGGRKILLDPSLGLSNSTRQAIELVLERAGGVIVRYHRAGGRPSADEAAQLVDDADVLVTRHRAGWSYIKAVRANKVVGTLAWVIHINTVATFISPFEHLMHYPTSAQPIPNFERHRITITNYTGDAREYLKQLIRTLGGTFEPALRTDCTAVLAAYLGSPKTDKAAAWGLPIMHHVWLEDCLLQWRDVPPAAAPERYCRFPAGVDFAAQVGARPAGERRLFAREALLTELAAIEAAAGPEPVPKARSRSRSRMRSAPSSPLRRSARVRGVSAGAVDTSAWDEHELGRRGADTDEDAETDAGYMKLDGLADTRDSPAPVAPRTTRGRPLVRRSGSRPDLDSLVEVGQMLGENGASKAGPSAHVNVPRSPRRSPTKYQSRTKAARRGGAGPEDEEEEAEEAPPLPRAKAPNSVRSRKPASAGKAKNEAPAPAGSDGSDEVEMVPNVEPAAPSGRVRPRPKPTSKPASSRKPASARPATPERASLAPRPAPSTPANRAPRMAVMVEIPRTPETAALVREASMRIAAGEAGPSSSPKRARPLPSPAKAPAPAHTEENADEPSDLSSPPPSSPPQRKAAPTASRKRAAPTRDSSPDPEAAKENTIVEPEGRSRRGAAVRAEDKLKDAMQDANSFALQKRRGASVVAAPWEKNGGKRAGTTAADGATKGKKRAGTHESDEEEAEEGSQRPAKKAKVAPASKRNTKAESMDEEDVGQDEAIDGEDEKVQPKVLITMAVIPDTTMTAFKRLGAVVLTKATEDMTHLVTTAVKRSAKALAAIPKVHFMVSEEWILESVKAKRFLPEGDYSIQDTDNKYDGLTGAEILRRRDTFKPHGIFAQRQFYITQGITKGDRSELALLRTVVQANGGKLTTQIPTARALEADPRKHLVSCAEDMKLWKSLARSFPVFSKEFILNCAFTQQMDLENKALRVPGSF